MAEDVIYDAQSDRMVSTYPPRFTIKYKGIRIEHDGYSALAFAVGLRMADVYYKDIHHSGHPISKDDMVTIAKQIVESHPEWIEQAKNNPPAKDPIFHPDYVRKTPQVSRRVSKAKPKPRKVFLKGEAKEKKIMGVTCLINVVSNTVETNTVARYDNWNEAIRGMKGGQGFQIYQGVPMTQKELTTHYPELERYTGLTKSKIGTGNVLFTNVDMPIVVQHKGYAYMVAPTIAEDKAFRQVPESMTKPKLTAEGGSSGVGMAPKPPRTPDPSVPAILAPAPAAPPVLAGVPMGLGGGGIAPIPGVGAAAKRRQPAKKTAAKPAKVKVKKAAAPKTKAKKAAAKPKNGKAKKPAAGIELTAAQRKRLAAEGSIMIKRGGKFVTVRG